MWQTCFLWAHPVKVLHWCSWEEYNTQSKKNPRKNLVHKFLRHTNYMLVNFWFQLLMMKIHWLLTKFRQDSPCTKFDHNFVEASPSANEQKKAKLMRVHDISCTVRHWTTMFVLHCAVTLPILVTTNIMLFKLQTDHSRPVLLKSWTWLGHCMNFMALLRFCATEVIRGAQITS